MLMTEKKKPSRVEPKNTNPCYTTRGAGVVMGGLNAATVWRLCTSGQLGYFKIGNRYMVRQSDIDEYLNRNSIPPKKEEKEDEE